MMKVFATLLAVLAVANAFAPMPAGRANTQLAESLFDKIFGMDLYAPVKDNNQYGTYKKKGLKQGKLSANSYVPEGLTKAQYAKIRGAEAKKKEANYQKNAKKAGIFEDYTLFYTKRGTDTSAAWKKSPTLGHRMAKTKYDFDTNKYGKLYDGNTK